MLKISLLVLALIVGGGENFVFGALTKVQAIHLLADPRIGGAGLHGPGNRKFAAIFRLQLDEQSWLEHIAARLSEKFPTEVQALLGCSSSLSQVKRDWAYDLQRKVLRAIADGGPAAVEGARPIYRTAQRFGTTSACYKEAAKKMRTIFDIYEERQLADWASILDEQANARQIVEALASPRAPPPSSLPAGSISLRLSRPIGMAIAERITGLWQRRFPRTPNDKSLVEYTQGYSQLLNSIHGVPIVFNLDQAFRRTVEAVLSAPEYERFSTPQIIDKSIQIFARVADIKSGVVTDAADEGIHYIKDSLRRWLVYHRHIPMWSAPRRV